MWVTFGHLRPSGHIMPDHAGDRGAVLLVLAPHDHLHIKQSRTFRTCASVARVGRMAGWRTGSSLGVLAVLVTASLVTARGVLVQGPVTLARLPGRGVVGAGGVLSGCVLGSGLGSRWALAGVVRRRSASVWVAVFAGHGVLVLVSGWVRASWHARGLGFESP